MTNIKSIEFGSDFINKIINKVAHKLKKGAIYFIVNDYNKMNPEKNKLGNIGIHVNGNIMDFTFKLIYNDDCIHFIITNQIKRYIDSKVKFEFLTDQHFVYFSDVVDYMIEFEDATDKLKMEFRQDLPDKYKRQEKINTLLL